MAREELSVDKLREAIRSMPKAPEFLTVKDLKAKLDTFGEDDGVVIADGRFMIIKNKAPGFDIPKGYIALSEPLMQISPFMEGYKGAERRT